MALPTGNPYHNRLNNRRMKELRKENVKRLKEKLMEVVWQEDATYREAKAALSHVLIDLDNLAVLDKRIKS